MAAHLDSVAHGLFGTAVRWASQVRGVLADARERQALRRELQEREIGGDIDVILADAGLMHSDLEPLIRGFPEAPRLLRGMTERLGVDGEYRRDAVVQHEVERTCALCAEHRRCRRWLSSGREDGYQEFCPNAELFDMLRRRKAERSRTQAATN